MSAIREQTSDAPSRRDGVRGWVLFFLLGCVSLVIQTTLIRETLFAFHGGEIALGLFFAFWLGGIGLGARLAARASGRGAGNSRAATQRFALGLALLVLAGLVQLAAFRHHRLMLPIAPGGYLPALSYLGLLAVAAFPAAWLTGFLFPIGLRATRMSAGYAYATEALGSTVGGAFAALHGLAHMNATALIASTAPIACSCLLIVGVFASPERRPAGTCAGQSPARRDRTALLRARPALSAVAILLIVSFLLFSGLVSAIDRAWLRARWRGLATGTEPVLFIDTPYHQATIGERDKERFLYIDGLYRGAIADPYLDSLSATVVATQHPQPRNVMVLAPAFYGAARVLADASEVRLTVVRNDSRLDHALPPNGTTARVTDDPRRVVRRMNASVDVLAILHGGPSGGAENRLYTAEFFAACARALAPGGVLVLDLPGTANVAAPEAARMRGSIASALRREFHDVRIAPGDPHYLFAALPRARAARDEIRPLTWDPDTLAVRRHRLWPSARAWPAAAFARLFPRDRVNELRAELEREVGATERANEDLHPSVYYEELVRWDRLSGSGLAKLLGTWRSRPGLMSGLLLGFFFAGAVFVSRRSGQAYVSLATTGMAGMAIDILLLFLFQTLAGTLYLRIGLVVALFMIGLAAGSLIGARAKRLSIAATDWLWVGALGASLPLLHLMSGVSSRAASAVILPLAFAFGLLTALPFPRVAERLRGTDAHAAAAARAGGLADAADHAGALCGALLAGTLLIPLLGFANTLLFLAAVKACAVLGWRIRARGPTPARARA